MRNSVFTESLTGLIILLFSYTGISKIIEHEGFHFVLSESPLIRYGAGAIAWIIPATELIVVLLLFFPRTRLHGLYASLLLLTAFTGYLIYIVLFFEKLPCHCGGVISSMTWKEHIFFNLFFMAASAVVIIIHKRKRIT